LKSDVRVVKELPLELQSLDLEAIGSLVSVPILVKGLGKVGKGFDAYF
jgi:hypothetical protein